MPVLGEIDPTGTYEQFKDKCSLMAVDFADLRTECGIGGRTDTAERMRDGISGAKDVRYAIHSTDITGRNLEMTKSITLGLDAHECGGRTSGFVVISDGSHAIEDEGKRGEREGPSGTVIKPGRTKESKHKHVERERDITMPRKMGEEVDSDTERVPNEGHGTSEIGVPFQAAISGTQTGSATERLHTEKNLRNVEVTIEDDKESGSRGRSMETKNGTDGAQGAANKFHGQWEMREGVVSRKQTGKAFERKGRRNMVILESDSDQHAGAGSRGNLPAESSSKRSEGAEKKPELGQEELRGLLSQRHATRLKRQKNVLSMGDAGNIVCRKKQDSSSEIVAADSTDGGPAKVPKQRSRPGRPFASSIAQKGDKLLKNFGEVNNQTPSQPEIDCFFNHIMPKLKRERTFHTADNCKNVAALQRGEPSRHPEHQLSAKHIEPYARTQVMEGSDSSDDHDYQCHTNKPGSFNEEECSVRAEERGNQRMRVKAEGAELEWPQTYLRDGANRQKERSRKRRSNVFDESDELLELGSDGHEERCHMCRRFGDLLCCDGCPISTHSSCLQLLSLKIPQPDEEWYCPVCCEKKATDLANRAQQAVTVAREKMEAFRKESSNKHLHSEIGLSGQYKTGRGSKHFKITGHHSAAPVKNTNEIEGRAVMTMRHSQDLLKVLKARKDLLRQNLASAELALFASKPLKLDKWRALYDDADSSSEETLDRNNRQEDEVEAGFREISAAARDIRCNLDFLEHGFNPVFQALEEVRDVGPSGLMFDKRTASHVKQRANSGKEVGSSAEERRSRVEAQILSTTAVNCREPRRREGPKLHAVHGDSTGDRKSGTQSGVATERRGLYKIPGLRRKVVPWTKTEEDVLKEGVQKFSHDDHSAYQWKEILEFGVGRFQPGRTAVDLKDKWRNLQKGVS